MLQMPRYISLDRHRTTTEVTKYTEKSTRYRTRVGVVLSIRAHFFICITMTSVIVEVEKTDAILGSGIIL